MIVWTDGAGDGGREAGAGERADAESRRAQRPHLRPDVPGVRSRAIREQLKRVDNCLLKRVDNRSTLNPTH